MNSSQRSTHCNVVKLASPISEFIASNQRRAVLDSCQDAALLVYLDERVVCVVTEWMSAKGLLLWLACLKRETHHQCLARSCTSCSGGSLLS